MTTPDYSSLDGLSNAEALDRIAKLIDAVTDKTDDAAIEQAFAMSAALEKREIEAADQALLDYFRSNAGACRYQKRHGNREQLWDFDQPEIQQQVYFLRLAAHSSGFASLHPVRRCQILTNLGNCLDTLGRSLEARASWSAALAIEPQFWMARGNRANALIRYGHQLHSEWPECVFALYAHRDLQLVQTHISLRPDLGNDGLAAYYQRAEDSISKHFDLAKIDECFNPTDGAFGRSRDERAYRRWCLRKTLFLNVFNDVVEDAVSAGDTLDLPPFVTPLTEPPVAAGMFNELVQSFASARFFLWEAVERSSRHFSDRDVSLYNTLDYPAYGLSVEKLRIAYRMGYSILDKVAYFLDHYLDLKIPERAINFRTLWWNDNDAKKGVREIFRRSENAAFRGLFWLSKDLFDREMHDTMEPQARKLADLRNHLEHKYVKVHEWLMGHSGPLDLFHDTKAHSIVRDDLEGKSLRLLQLVRSALIYLTLGMHQEERKRYADHEGKVAPMSLYSWDYKNNR